MAPHSKFSEQQSVLCAPAWTVRVVKDEEEATMQIKQTTMVLKVPSLGEHANAVHIVIYYLVLKDVEARQDVVELTRHKLQHEKDAEEAAAKLVEERLQAKKRRLSAAAKDKALFADDEEDTMQTKMVKHMLR